MAHNLYAQVVLPSANGLPEDACVNTFAFESDAVTPVVGAVAVANRLVQFYNTLHGAGPPTNTTVSGCIATSISRAVAGARINVYNLGNPISLPLGSPILSSPWTVGEIGDEEVISEAAVCLSYHADLTDIPEEVGTTRPRARRRGRLYIGPIRSSLVTELDGSERRRPNAFLMNTWTEAGRFLAIGADPRWMVWSREDNVLRKVTGGFVDNAFDTQRRRGPAAGLRLTFTDS